MKKIVDPESGLEINLYSDRVNQLLKTYNEDDLINGKITPLMNNRNNVFIDDILYTIMLNLDIKDIVSLSNVDKNAKIITNNPIFWEYIIKRDNLYIEGVDFTEKSYYNLYNIKLKIKNLKLKNVMIFNSELGHINLNLILTSGEIVKILKEIEKVYEYNLSEISSISLYKGYRPNERIFSVTFLSGYTEITLLQNQIDDILFKFF
jgi:hypothetical protein